MSEGGSRASSPATLPDVAFASVLLAIAAAAWAATTLRMDGMSGMGGMGDGRWSYLADLALLTGTWVLMMAAMMLPSIVPTVVAYERAVRRRSGLRTGFAMSSVFAAGYLAVWAVAGLVAYIVLRLAGGLLTVGAGRFLAGGVLVAAAAYQLVPLRRGCLRRLSAPLARRGPIGALRTGVESGWWCVGCSWALMASLLALGLMSLTWMVVIWVMVMAERLLPSRERLASLAVAAVLAALAAGVVWAGRRTSLMGRMDNLLLGTGASSEAGYSRGTLVPALCPRRRLALSPSRWSAGRWSVSAETGGPFQPFWAVHQFRNG